MPALDRVKELYRGFHGRDFTEADSAALGGEASFGGMSDQDFITKVIQPSEEYQTRDDREKKAYLTELASQRQAMLDKQKAEQEGLFGQYEAKLGSQAKLTDLYNKYADETGYNTFKKEFDTTRDLLDRLDDDVTDRTEGTLTTDAQRRRIIAAESDPLQKNLGRLGIGLDAAGRDTQTKLQLAQFDQGKELKPIEMRINALSDRFAREITGFDSTKQTELTFLLDSIQSGRQMAAAELERVHALAAEEREWERTQKTIKQQFELQQQAATVDFDRQKQLADQAFSHDVRLKQTRAPGDGGTPIVIGGQSPTEAKPAAPAAGPTGARITSNSQGIQLARSALAAGDKPDVIYSDLIANGIDRSNAQRIIQLITSGN